MEVICAFLVLGCAFLLSFLASDSAVRRASRIDRIPDVPPSPSPGNPLVSQLRPRPGLQVDRERREKLLRTVEDEPEAVAETLKQWIQE
jgi:flagellar biosynthesis/type III secretory pathway M-ring protein FliF/YscJ